MIKRFFVVFCLAVSSISAVNACDACGCTVSGLGIGLMTDYRSNFIRLSYFETRFNSNPEHGHHNSTDVFSRMDVSVRYSFARLPKLRFIGHLPYGRNRRNSNDTESTVHGFSDVKFLLNYTLLNGRTKNDKASFYVEAGGGINLPTGKYDGDIADKNLPENFNIGNGSLGYIFQLNSVLSNDVLGLLINNNYQLNNEVEDGYHFGNQFSSQLTAFKELPIGNLGFIPNVGLLYEKIASDEYSNGNNVPETGGEGLFFSSAINFKTDEWLAGVSYSLPIDQHYSSGVIDAGRKLAFHFSYLF
jgi:hypothetical protein